MGATTQQDTPSTASAGLQQGAAPKDPIHFSDAAAYKVVELIEEENNPAIKLRVSISGGGCSGFQYGITFDEKQNDDDIVIEKTVLTAEKERTVALLIDSMSFSYLIGATVDYKEDLQGSRFLISNPNAKTTCGCGSSFSI